jgi:hypothetical protein
MELADVDLKNGGLARCICEQTILSDSKSGTRQAAMHASKSDILVLSCGKPDGSRQALPAADDIGKNHFLARGLLTDYLHHESPSSLGRNQAKLISISIGLRKLFRQHIIDVLGATVSWQMHHRGCGPEEGF